VKLTSQLHILLVEDNRADIWLLREILRKSMPSCQLSVVEDGEQALTFLRQEGAYTAASRPDLLLLDLNLPKIDGRVVLRMLRATPEWKTLPVMILTGSWQETDHQELVALGVTRYLQKSMHLKDYRALGEDIATWWQWRELVPIGGNGNK
jgi:two-component system, chemotaxis family, response regulator Rcp1